MSVEATQTGSQEFKLMSGPTHQTQPYKPLRLGDNISRGCFVILQSPLMLQLPTAKSHPYERRRYQTPWFIRNRGMFMCLVCQAIFLVFARVYRTYLTLIYSCICSPLCACACLLHTNVATSYLNDSTVW